MDYPEDIDPIILKKLTEGHPIVCDDLYAYRLSSGVIERIVKVDYVVGGSKAFHIPREKPRSINPLQQTFSKG